MNKISEEIIKNRVMDSSIFNRGKSAYLDGKVKSVRTNPTHTYFEGTILDGDDRTAKVNFNDKGSIIATNCTCETFLKYQGDCRHIVALMVFINDYIEKENQKAKREKEITDMIYYYEPKVDKIKDYLEVEYTIEINPMTRSKTIEGLYLSIKIGDDKLYSLRNPNELFEHMDSGLSLEFGKQFIYSSEEYIFKEEDYEIIDFLKAIHENLPTESSNFKTKRIELTNRTGKNILNALRNRNISLVIEDKTYENISIVDGDIPLIMDVVDEGTGLSIDLKSEDEIYPITDDLEYIFYRDKIYKSSSEHRKRIRPIYEEIYLKENGSIKIKNQHREAFIANVLPSIKSHLDLNLDQKIEDSIYTPELKSKIYFDKEKSSIIGRIKFIYGDIDINPFSSKDEEIKTNKILIRDIRKEQKILSILEGASFKVIDGGIYLDREDRIYKLISEIIPKLQEYSDIYYSENFKAITIRQMSNVSGGLRLNEDLDLLEFDFEIDGAKVSEIQEIYKAIKNNKKFYRLKDGSFLPLEDDKLDELFSVISNIDISLEGDKIRFPKYMTMYLDAYLNKEEYENIEKDKAFKEVVKNIHNPKNLDFEVPKILEDTLRDYQVFGFKWLKTMAYYGFGGILADDMGLGKTIQVITFLLSEKEEKGSKPSLIVVPTSLVYNWEEEINKFSQGDLKTLIVHGSKEERTKALEEINDYDIVITSYPLIRNDIDIYSDKSFRYCILDEAQHIKNSNSLSAKAVKSIQSENRFALTGTPMENSILELWSIFDFLMPGYLFSYHQFVEEYEKPIFRDEDHGKLEELNSFIRPFILRRLKTEVLKELPDKIEQKILVDMTEEQKAVYASYINTLKDELESEIESKGFNRSHIKILTALTRLRQICSDPRLFIDDYTGGSGKLDVLKDILKEAIKSGHRILIFSQFTSMLDIIEDELKYLGIDTMYLSGSTKMADRNVMVREFNEGEADVFLISLKAGGSGLNLTGANMVIHYDPWWNPAVEDQATDRAYRIGQENIVQVLKLITKGTIEEKIFTIQERKKEMIDMVIKEGETLISKLTEDEILSLFNI